MGLPDIALAAGLAIIAILYSSVGQGDGSGYIAAMGLIGFGPEVIKPTALALNALVAAIGCVRFYRFGLLEWRNCYPFLILSMPLALIGGATNLPAAIYQPLVGALLLVTAVQMWRSARGTARHDESVRAVVPLVPALLAGGGIGFVSGLTGLGGGVFLAPLVLMAGWLKTRQTAATTAAFNLANSGLALAGLWTVMPVLPAQLPWWMAAARLGGVIGSWLGVRYLPPSVMRLIIGIVLTAAGTRMVLS